MKCAVVIHGKLMFLEGNVEEIVECVDRLGLKENTIRLDWIQPVQEPQSWEGLRDFVKGVEHH
jgi:hypothetical protein